MTETGDSDTIASMLRDTGSHSRTTRHRSSMSRNGSRPGTRLSRRTAPSTIGGDDGQEVICAVSEARGISPVIGLAFVNLTTSEAVLCQISDNAFYAKTINKIQVFEPVEILMMNTMVIPSSSSNMHNIVKDNCAGSRIVTVDRKYWSETAGLKYIQELALSEDAETLKVSVGPNYYATCCLAATLKFMETNLSLSFSYHSLRIRYEPCEGSMMIDLSTIQSLELIQNLQNSKSRDCLFGLLNETLTPMGSRCLRTNILQPSTQKELLDARYSAVHELSINEEIFFETRQALKSFLDADKLLTRLVLIPVVPDMQYAEQSINNILILKTFAHAIHPVYEALGSAKSSLLEQIREQCHPDKISRTIKTISAKINEDVSFSKTPLDLRNQRTYAVKSGVNGLLDVARQTYKEATADIHRHVSLINETYELRLETRFDNSRGYYLRLPEILGDDHHLPDVIINRYPTQGHIDCQTLDLIKLNQRIRDSSQEVVSMSNQVIQELLSDIRSEVPILFKVCEGVAMLDMLAAFAHLVSTRDYVRPELTKEFAIKDGRHPIREKFQFSKFIPNDYYASQQSRFQILTGCNMSGKSTYIRSIALITIIAQVGCFVPAEYAAINPIHQMFARVSMDDLIEANVSTFANEMRETACILRNVTGHSMVIIDELGRGTSTRDGLAISIAIAEALIDSQAFVWFATHFRELAQILNERNGVVNMHLAASLGQSTRITMHYKRTDGFIQEANYGIALAKVVGLPSRILDIAEAVSCKLEQSAEDKKKGSAAVAIARKRKLVLALRESLIQAQEGSMNGSVLLSWLRKLQAEFVSRMEAIDEDKDIDLRSDRTREDSTIGENTQDITL